MCIASTDFKKHLKKNRIEIIPQFLEENLYRWEMTEEDILNQMGILSEFHKRVMGFDIYLKSKIKNKIGREVEENKVDLRRLKKDIQLIEKEGPSNNFEVYLKEIAPKFIKRGERALKVVHSSYYVEMILRSMRKKEICIQNVGRNNMRKNKDVIEIGSIKNICYNLVEMDCIYMIRGLRKSGYKYNWESLCNGFCKKENIDQCSVKFILSLVSYPTEFMRCCNRYRENKKDWSIERYINKLNKSVLRDGESLI